MIFNSIVTPKLMRCLFAPFLLFMVILPLAVSCTNDKKDVPDDSDFEEVDKDSTMESSGEECVLPAVNMASSMPDFLKQQVETRFTSLSATISHSAKVVFASAAELYAQDRTLVAAYENGATIVVIDTDEDIIEQWLSVHDIEKSWTDNAGTADKGHNHLIYAFNNRHRYYYFDELHDNGCKEELAFFPVRFDSFVNWINKYADEDLKNAPKNMTRASNGEYDIESTFGNQVITHNFAMELSDKTIAHVIFSKPDKLTKTSSIDVTLTVYPLYSPQSNGSSHGDYYIIKGYVNAHNAGMYKGKWSKYHGGVKSHMCAFYMNKLDVETYVRQNNGEVEPKFPVGGTPVPQTTALATSYTSGFSWSISGNILGKLETGTQGGNAGVSGTCSWNNSETRSLPDVTIKRDTEHGKIKWTFNFNNLPDDYDDKIPDLAISDFETNFTWIWWMQGDPKQDKENYEYECVFKLQPKYTSWHWYSSSADFSTDEFWGIPYWKDNWFTFKLRHPERK